MRVVFFGTPEFAVPSLEALASKHDVVLAVAQPDRPAGRGMKLHKPAVAERATALGIDVIQPAKIRTEEFLSRIAATNADAAIVIAYGRILPAPLLRVPREGFINVHGSILPKYRGAAPIQRAIEAGDNVTGVTIMRVDDELDHGAILRIEEMEIGADERFPSVSARMAQLGAAALLRTLDAPLEDTPQDHARATHAPKIEKHEGLITFEEPAKQIYNRFRAFDPWPGMFFETSEGTIKAPDLQWSAGNPAGVEARTIISIANDQLQVAVGEGTITFNSLQRPNKSKTTAAEVARALHWRAGEKIH